MKGVSLQITFIVLLALAIAVMTFSIIYFRTQTGSLNEMNDKRYLMTCCQKWIEHDNCGPSVGPGGSTLPGCDNFYSLAKKYNLTDLDKLKDFCECPGYGD